MKFSQSFKTGQYQQQKQVQKLAITQQLQQSIQMLAYSNEELKTFIDQKSLENPFLNVEWDNGRFVDTFKSQRLNGDLSDQIQQYIEQLPDNYKSLYSPLEEQIYLNYRKTPIRDLMIELLDYLDENGYLTIDLKEVITVDKSETMWIDALVLLQQLEPAGIGARDLQECLLLQIERDNTAPNLAYLILEESFDDFINHKFDLLSKKYQITKKELQNIADYLLNLTPHPGNIYNKVQQQFIVPELTVQKINDKLKLTLNKYGQPKVTLEEQYYQDIKELGDQEAQKFAKDKKNEVKWIEKSLLQRKETILAVGQVILDKQHDFFMTDNHKLKPLSLKEIAKETGVHESTISRTINGKYLETWFGIFELKTFLIKKAANSSGDQTIDDVKKALKKIINNENKQKLYSDQKLVEELSKNGFSLSRRTVAKYREELGIASSSKRKRYI